MASMLDHTLAVLPSAHFSWGSDQNHYGLPSWIQRRGALFSGTGRCHCASPSLRKDAPSTVDEDKKRYVERRWQKFFANPSQWWDHRWEKENGSHPDFKHKETESALWVDGKLNPPWVKAKLAAMPSETLQDM